MATAMRAKVKITNIAALPNDRPGDAGNAHLQLPVEGR